MVEQPHLFNACFEKFICITISRSCSDVRYFRVKNRETVRLTVGTTLCPRGRLAGGKKRSGERNTWVTNVENELSSLYLYSPLARYNRSRPGLYFFSVILRHKTSQMATSKTNLKRTATTPIKRQAKKVRKLEIAETTTANKVPCSVIVIGDGDTGQLGLGPDVTEKARPAVVSNLKDIIEVAVGGMHTVVLTKDNKVLTFGCNDEGALGRDTSVEGSETSPAPVDIPAKVVQISAGDSHTAAITDEGLLYAWGTFRDTHGSMGLYHREIEKFPVLIKSSEKFSKVASGAHHLVLLGVKGDVYTSGCGEQGQLGRLSERSAHRYSRQGLGHLLTPTLVHMPFRNKVNIVNIWTGSYNTFVQNTNGDVYVFGLNNYNQLGIDNSSEDKNVYFHPKLSETLSGKNWVKISGGEHHTLALDDTGTVYALGRKEYGRLGLGENCSDAVKLTEVKIGENEKCSDISCGSFTSFAVSRDGKFHSWGMSSNMLGHGDSGDVFVPTLVEGKQLVGKTVLKVAGGGQHTVALMKA